MKRRTREFTWDELNQTLATLRVVRGLYYVAHPDARDGALAGDRHVDVLIDLVLDEMDRRPESRRRP